MKLLLDTHLLIWGGINRGKVPQAVVELLNNPENVAVFSVVSIWEIALKFRLNRPDFDVEPALFRRGLLENGYEELLITSAHAIGVASLPLIHRDPFDRLLVAQAAAEGIILLTNDSLVAQYPGPIRLV